MQAQTYEKLWTDCAKAFNDDLPKTAIETLHTIRQKATAEGNNTQLLRALVTECTVSSEISPDSLSGTLQLVQTAMDAESRVVEKALWKNAYGQLLLNSFPSGKKVLDHQKLAQELLVASVADCETLAAAKTKDYVPLFALGKDSRFLNDNLLSVLTKVLRNYWYQFDDESRAEITAAEARLREVYVRENNQAALLLLDFEENQNKELDDAEMGDFIARIRTLMPLFKGTNAGKALQDFVKEQEQPSIRLSFTGRYGGSLYPGEAETLNVNSKNIAKAELRIYSTTGVSGEQLHNDCLGDDAVLNYLWKHNRGKLIQTQTLALQHAPAHVLYKDSVTLALPQTGIYLAELVVDGKTRNRQVLCCSRIAPVFFSYGLNLEKHERLSFVDAKTGEPCREPVALKMVSNCSEDVFNPKSAATCNWTVLQPDVETQGHWCEMHFDAPEAAAMQHGVFDVSTCGENTFFAVTVGGDASFPVFELGYNRFWGSGVNNHREVLSRLYTDRAIYRPGQKVQFSGVVYSRNNDDYAAVSDWTGTVCLRDTKGKELANVAVSTDEMGSFCGEFVLPDPTVPGSFCLFVQGNGVRNSCYIKVEEYKRPTFRVELEKPDPKALFGRTQFEIGDTVKLQGQVNTYSGVPVPEAKVSWKISRQSYFWWRAATDSRFEQTGELVSDSEGRFEVLVPLTDEGIDKNSLLSSAAWLSYRFTTEIEVLATNGESSRTSHTILAREPNPHPQLPEAENALPRVQQQTNDAETESSMTLRIPGAWVFYDVVSSKTGLAESQVQQVRDSLRLTLHWTEALGDGAVGYVTLVQDGVLETYRMTVKKPKPDKRLLMAWSTFRDYLQPGQDETWTLRVNYPDGKPADALVMARLYDASLDAFVKDEWDFRLTFDRYLPQLRSRRASWYLSDIFYNKSLKLNNAHLRFTDWEPSMFEYFSAMTAYPLVGLANAKKTLRKTNTIFECLDVASQAAPKAYASKAEGSDFDQQEEEQVDAAATAEAMQAQVRENFDETAFFMPQLRTDERGIATLAFTLPESLTQWNFSAFAHDKQMNYGLLTDTVIAQKKIMAEIAAPRFLRDGDETEIPVTVRNLTEAAVNGELIFVVSDAATLKALKTEKRGFKLEANESTTLLIPLKASMAALGISADQIDTSSSLAEALGNLLLRAVAQTKPAKQGEETFSDGEQRQLPLLSGRVAVQTTVPFSATEPGNVSVDVSRLQLNRLMAKDKLCQPKLTVEYSANPIWNVVRVLPVLISDEAYSATGWATRLYGIEIADYLRKQYSTDELTQQLPDAATIAAYRYTALDHLKTYQKADGGFAWFADFESSPWITTDVSILLARQQKMTKSRTAASMLKSAMSYLEKEMAKEVAEMRKAKYQVSASELQLRYLYLRQLQGLTPNEDVQYLLDLAAKERKSLTMYGKSALAQVLADAAKAGPLSEKVSAEYLSAADLALQSLVEHTVFTEEMGRYFDTQRAMNGWASYRIPTQTMAIEALDNINLTRNSRGWLATQDVTRLQNEFRLWLLQSKRTQQWDNSRATADATYALLHRQPYQPLTPEDYSRQELTPAETAKVLKSGSYNIIKTNDGLSWGALYADYTLPASQVEQSSAGMTLQRRWEVLREGKWQEISGQTVRIGEHVRQIFSLRAERDFDFVQLEASRPACLEPVRPLSGKTWQNGLPAYRMVRDSRNDFYIEHLAKGDYDFTEEYVVDRAGSFTSGIAHAVCSYAPEFGAYAPSTTLKTSK